MGQILRLAAGFGLAVALDSAVFKNAIRDGIRGAVGSAVGGGEGLAGQVKEGLTTGAGYTPHVIAGSIIATRFLGA